MRQGIERRNRQLLEQLHRKVAGPFTVAEAASIWSLSTEKTRRLLRYLECRGWLSRVRQGMYSTVPLGAGEPSEWREDPWLTATKSFEPCYIGGWSACGHWELTEQLFRDIVVMTGQRVRDRRLEVQGTPFRLKHLAADRHFGTRTIWRNQVKVKVSDPTRTMVDLLDDPSIGGGIRHIAGVLRTYFAGEHRNDMLMSEYADRLDNRTVFKRLGFLLEALQVSAPELIGKCERDLSRGLSSLDPTVKERGRILKRWNLRVNVTLNDKEQMP